LLTSETRDSARKRREAYFLNSKKPILINFQVEHHPKEEQQERLVEAAKRMECVQVCVKKVLHPLT
jgi:hypothetical protein